MNKVLYIVLSILILTSCNKTEKLDGIWFVAYQDFPGYKTEPLSQKTLLEFNEGFVYTIKIGDVSTGNLHSVVIDTAAYSFNNSILKIEEEEFNIIYSQDSIIFNHNNSPQSERRTILKRLNDELKNKKFNKNNFSGTYGISSKLYNDSIDFINDSIVIFTGQYNSNFPVYKWGIINHKGFKILNIQNELFPLLIFKSQASEKTVLEYPIQKNKNFIFSEIDVPDLSNLLIGNWRETKINVPKPMPPYEWIKDGDQYYNLSFTQDSLIVSYWGRDKKNKWSLTGANQRIYFIDKILTEQGSWKILELTEHLLTIKISKRSGIDNEIVYLEKENKSY